jgi:hypothetical protein
MVSALTKIGFACLPWLPLLALSLTIYERFFAPKYVTEATIRVDGPSTFYTSEEQWAQIWPHWNLIVAALVFFAVVFLLGIILLAVSLIRYWIRRAHASQAI